MYSEAFSWKKKLYFDQNVTEVCSKVPANNNPALV